MLQHNLPGMRYYILVFLLIAVVAATAQNPAIVKTVTGTNLEPSSDAVLNKHVTPWNGKLFFQGKGSATQCHLAMTDGTTAGTVFIKDLGNVGDIDGIYPAQDFVYITTLQSEIVSTSPFVINWKRNLWKTDGTAAGTILLKNFPTVTSTTNTGIFYSNAQNTVNWSISGNVMYFNGYDAASGAELWVTDGTAAGTMLVKDIYPGTNSGNPLGFCKVGSTTCFVARDAANGYQLWKTDGTSAGTQIVTIINPAGAIAEFYFGLYKGKMYFFANDGVTGAEVWGTDGTAAGTQLLKDIVAGNNATTGSGGARTDIYFIQDDNYLYFPIERSKYIWRTDGTTAGTIQLSGLMSSQNIAGAIAKGKYMYWLDNVTTLYKTDGTPSGTALVKNSLLQATQLYSYRNAAWMNCRGFANNSDAEPWRSDGTAANTARALDVFPGGIFGIYNSSDPQAYFELNGYLYFFASNSTGKHLFRYDGDMTFNGSVTGAKWSDSSNWNSMMPPGIIDTALIGAGLTVNVNGAKAFAGTLLMNAGSAINLNAATDSLFIGTELKGTSVTGNGVLVLRSNSTNPLQLTSALNATNLNVQGNASLGAALTVQNNLNLTNAARLIANNNNVVLNGNSSTITGDAGNYIVTNGTGSLTVQDMGTGGRAGSVAFPIGTITSYNPATITNTGTMDAFSVRVQPGVNAAYTGETPSGGNYTTNAVAATWFIDEQVAGGSNANVTLQWNAAQELPGFDRSASRIGHYTGGAWQTSTAGAATGTDPYTFTAAGFSGFSPFSVLNANPALPLQDIRISLKRSGNNNHLNWSLTTSSAVSIVALQRSADATNFTTIFSTRDALPQSYNDIQMLFSKLYYRLKIVYIDGSVTYSNLVWTKKDQASTEVYPTAITDRFYVQYAAPEPAKIMLFSTDGKMMLAQPLHQGTNTINVKQLPAGTWYYTIVNLAGERTSGSVLKY